MVRTEPTQLINLPPAGWLEYFARPQHLVDQSELKRAAWLWARRPRYVLVDGAKILWGRIVGFGLVILFLATFDVTGLLIAAGLGFFGATLLTFDLYWRVRWQRDYLACMRRLLK
jgi:hypothetical protein